jgi:DNA-binding NtrC family response regulator
MQLLVEYSWPGNVRELRNLIESMVVLAPGREIEASDIPREIREGGGSRFLPVPVGPLLRGQQGAGGRELEFIVRSLVELKLQVEELRARMQSTEAPREVFTSRISSPTDRVLAGNVLNDVDVSLPAVSAIEPPGQNVGPRTITIAPGMTMADIERAAIQAALAETKGNRRKAAEMLGIGERTMYRKLRDYDIPVR